MSPSFKESLGRDGCPQPSAAKVEKTRGQRVATSPWSGKNASRRTLGSSIPTFRQHCRGSILIVVLGFIILLSFIVVAFVDEVVSKIKYYGLFHEREDLRVEAYSALETALATINAFAEADEGLISPSQGWDQPLTFVGYTGEDPNVQVSVTVEDISGRFPLRVADETILLEVFTAMEFDIIAAQELSDHLRDWMDEDDLSNLNGFDGDDYLREDPPYRAANQPLRSWDELRLIKELNEVLFTEEGLPNEQYRLFTSLFTLDGEHAVNLNTAPVAVLNILAEMGLIDVLALQNGMAGLDGELGTADDQFLRGQGPGVLSESDLFNYQVETLRVSAEARRGEAFFLVETLVTWQGAATTGVNGQIVRENADDEDEDQPGTALPGRDRQPQTVATEASELGYPFQIMRLRENRRL